MCNVFNFDNKFVGKLTISANVSKIHFLTILGNAPLRATIQRASFDAILYTKSAFNCDSREIRNLPRVTSCLILKLDREYEW